MEQYIKKSALVAEIEKLKEEIESQDFAAYKEAYIIGVKHTLETVSDILNTLEVKEADMEKELNEMQEWSEEDENHVKSILSTIECCKAQFPNAQAVVEAYNADIEWLNSLRPQVKHETVKINKLNKKRNYDYRKDKEW